MSGYSDAWRNWKPGPGPTRWRGPHHGHPDPEFANLCAEADRRGLRVSLDVGTELFGREPHEYRRLGPLIVGIPERPQMVVVLLSDSNVPTFTRSLRDAAIQARRTLTALTGEGADA